MLLLMHLQGRSIDETGSGISETTIRSTSLDLAVQIVNAHVMCVVTGGVHAQVVLLLLMGYLIAAE